MTAGDLIVAILAGIGAILGGWATLKKANIESQSNVSSSLDTHMTRQDTRIKQLEHRVDASVIRERIRDDYIAQLRQHIADRKPPPPPMWPTGLLQHYNSSEHEGG